MQVHSLIVKIFFQAIQFSQTVLFSISMQFSSI